MSAFDLAFAAGIASLQGDDSLCLSRERNSCAIKIQMVAGLAEMNCA